MYRFVLPFERLPRHLWRRDNNELPLHQAVWRIFILEVGAGDLLHDHGVWPPALGRQRFSHPVPSRQPRHHFPRVRSVDAILFLNSHLPPTSSHEVGVRPSLKLAPHPPVGGAVLLDQVRLVQCPLNLQRHENIDLVELESSVQQPLDHLALVMESREEQKPTVRGQLILRSAHSNAVCIAQRLHVVVIV